MESKWKDKEFMKEYQRKWYLENKERKDEQRRANRQANREAILERERRYREENKEVINAQSRKANKKHYTKKREEILDKKKEYYKANRALALYVSRCSHIRTTYGVSVDYILDLLDLQKGCCSICGETLVHPDSKQSYSIDHCHDTGKVRGLLCHGCNLAIGHFQHNINILNKAIDYLSKN